MTKPCDILVVGAGPAGLALTARLAERGVDVANLAPSHPPEWPNTYGIWRDELAAAGLEDCGRETWPAPRICVGGGRSHRLDRAYTLIDNDALRGRLIDEADAGGADWRPGFARRATVGANGVTVEARGGERHRARAVVDATGHRPALVDRPDDNPGFQRARGVVVTCSDDPLDGDGMRLMDFRPLDGFRDDDADGPPSFLYAMNLGGGRYFFEETFLTTRPAASFGQLGRRLRRRLRQLGVDSSRLDDPDRVDATERVHIPMGVAVPDDPRPIVGFGGAAGMVHPATGYMIGTMLERAPAVADAAADALGRPDASGPTVARAMERAVWPEERVRTRRLLSFGMETLLTMNGEQTRRFFDTFFAMPEPARRDYLSGRMPPGRCATIMWTLFRDAPPGLKKDLGRAALSSNARHLAASLLNR